MKKRKGLSLICLLLLISLLPACSFQGSQTQTQTHVHVYLYEYSPEEQETHWKVCSICGEHTPEEPHSFTEEGVDASCDHPGYITYHCPTCCYTRTDITPTLAHRFESVPGSDARVCSICKRKESALIELPESERYGFLYLSSLEEAQKYLKAYQKLSAAIGSRQIHISFEEELSIEEFDRIFRCCVKDHPEYFWSDGYSVRYYDYYGALYIGLLYNMGEADLNLEKAAFNEATDEFLSGVSPSMTDFEKELYLHDTIVTRAVYDESISAPMIHNAYGILVNGTAVCDGYAKLLQHLLCRCGILATTLSGYAGGYHAWNAACIDGEWYMVDPTWDDPLDNDPDEVVHAYFNCTWESLSQSHSFVDPSDNPIENYVPIPTCTTEKYNYFTFFGYEGELTLATVQNAIRAQASRGVTDNFEIRFYGHGSTAEEKEANIDSFCHRQAHHICSTLGKAQGKFVSTFYHSFTENGDIVIISSTP